MPALNRVSVHLVCGPLGSGKTTLLRQLLQQRPAGETWALLINEWGEVGIDGPLLRSQDDGLAVREISGGCICCSSGPQLQLALRRLLSTHPQRLLIEPSGLASPARLIDMLRQPEFAGQVHLGPVITLVDLRRLPPPADDDLLQEQLQLADIVLGSHADQASPEQLHGFAQWAAQLWPGPLHCQPLAHGTLPLHWLDQPTLASPTPAATDAAIAIQPARHALHRRTSRAGRRGDWHWQVSRSGALHAGGWIVAPGWRFELGQLRTWLGGLPQWAAQQGGQLRRAKGLLRCGSSWRLFNWVDGQWQDEPVLWRRDSRWEILVEGGAPDWAGLDGQWQSLRLPPTAQTAAADSP